jgi:hypothetical protein
MKTIFGISNSLGGTIKFCGSGVDIPQTAPRVQQIIETAA